MTSQSTVAENDLGYAKLTSLTVATGLGAVVFGSNSVAGVPNGTSVILMAAEGVSVRWRTDGVLPTTTKGYLLAAGSEVRLTQAQARNVRIIGTAGGASVSLYALGNEPDGALAIPESPIIAMFAAGEQGIFLDPSDLSTMFQDSAGTTPVTGAGQPVGLILDKSGRNNHAFTGTAANRPILQIERGAYYLQFDGIDDLLSTGNIDFTGTSKMTAWVGHQLTAAASNAIFLEMGPNVSTTDGTFSMSTFRDATGQLGTTARATLGQDAINTAASSWPAGTKVVHETQVDLLQTTATVKMVQRINGALVTPNVIVDFADGTGNFTTQALNIGRRVGGTNLFNGRIYSMIVRGALSNSVQIATGENYVNGKIGAF